MALEKTLYNVKKFVPKKFLSALRPAYHFSLSLIAALMYRFPSRDIKIVGVTGTKGKTSTVEIINAILEEAGYITALAGTLRFKIGDVSKPNKKKMTMPGRLFLQRFIRRAVRANCQWIVLEMTSQGVLQHRHKFINLDALIFTNLSPEHIEAHGSFESYRDAKLEIARTLSKSSKQRRVLVVNGDDEHAPYFLETPNVEKHRYTMQNAKPVHIDSRGITFTHEGKGVRSALVGAFNLSNILGAITFANTLGIKRKVIKKAIESFEGIRGRLETINEGQDFGVIVDYAHTPDSLQKVYEVFNEKRKICVLGNTGGGRDKWKRKEMARIAENHCAHIILTNEDPYDEDPMDIIEEMAKAIHIPKYEIELDRRVAIQKAIKKAESGDVILITGKGTDPYIMEANGAQTPWDDAAVAREELKKYLGKRGD